VRLLTLRLGAVESADAITSGRFEDASIRGQDVTTESVAAGLAQVPIVWYSEFRNNGLGPGVYCRVVKVSPMTYFDVGEDVSEGSQRKPGTLSARCIAHKRSWRLHGTVSSYGFPGPATTACVV